MDRASVRQTRVALSTLGYLDVSSLTARVQVLFKLDRPTGLRTLEVLTPRQFEPKAVRTCLGASAQSLRLRTSQSHSSDKGLPGDHQAMNRIVRNGERVLNAYSEVAI